MRLLFALLTLLATACLPHYARAAQANVPATRLDANDYIHTRWTTDDGAPAAVRAMAQTTDGWLWLGAFDGLYRFDGVRFSRYALPSRLSLNHNLISHLVAGPKGELYISYAAEGASVLYSDGKLASLPPRPLPTAPVEMLAIDTDGSVWMASEGLFHLVGDTWEVVEQGGPFKQHNMRSLVTDQLGNLWYTRTNSTWRLERNTGRFRQILASGGDLVTAPDGGLWLFSDDGGMRLLTEPRTRARRPLATHAQDSLSAQFAEDGALWILNCPIKLCVASAPSGTRQTNVAQLTAVQHPVSSTWSSDTAHGILLDREGNIWINSDDGLHKFYRKRFVDSGLEGVGINYSIVADKAGTIWAANSSNGKLSILRPDGVSPVATPTPVTVLARSPDGQLLTGGPRSIFRRRDDGGEEVPLPQEDPANPQDRRIMGILDDGIFLWTATYQTGLLAWRDNNWTPARQFRLPAKIYQSARAGIGKLWLATGDGELFLYDSNKDSNSAATDIRAIGMPTAIFPGKELFISGDNGAGVVQRGRFALMRAADQNVLRNVSGQVVTADGDRWLNGAAGLVHVLATDWRRSVEDPNVPLRYELFNNLDGYPGRAVIENRWPSAISGDGRNLWLTTTGGVVRFDTQAIARNRIVPVPSITAVATEAGVYPATGPVRLPAGTHQFRIEFTAPSFRKPTQVRFEYRLDGIDKVWQEAGTRRGMNYTSLGPGDYIFHVLAINEDGLRSQAEATLPVTIVPTFVQTIWFRLLVAAALALLLAGAYRYRISYLTRRLSEQMQVKLTERERIARTLHDTFLQTVHSILLNVDAVAANLPVDDVARRRLEKVIEQSNTALGEGREQLQELRSDRGFGLEAALEKSIHELQIINEGITIALRVTGTRRDVPSATIDEINSIAREAARNACTHAVADQVRIMLVYGIDALTVTVTDNGQGIGASEFRKGAAQGHWGLVGMHERAARIGADLAIDDGAEGGTVVRLHLTLASAVSD